MRAPRWVVVSMVVLGVVLGLMIAGVPRRGEDPLVWTRAPVTTTAAPTASTVAP